VQEAIKHSKVNYLRPLSLKVNFFRFVLEIFSYLMTKQKTEMSQICIVSVKFLKDVRDFDRNAANWQ
jgi:hypothetical protein